ncbi:MAG: DUF72 domain-containing protein [Bacteroidetes bacterium]|nr:DUF72 domain-containing protein [Bacteroidota bacterium]
MKFGKLENIDQVDFSLPPQPAGNKAILDDLPHTDCRVYIGCTGWSMKEWVGKVYPPGTKTADFMQAYTRQFNTIEFNTTHYRIPETATVDKWREKSADDFRFCPKIPQSISHSGQLGADDPKLNLFCERIQGLDEKLGCCFIQLPPYFNLEKLPFLERFLGLFPQEIPLAVEVRHETFFEPDVGEALFKLLEKYDRTAVITDVAGRRDVLHMRLTNERSMVRFVGNGLHPTDYQRIDEWVEVIKNWATDGLREIYFFGHEPDNVLAPDICLYLFEKLQNQPGISVRGPRLRDKQDGQQISLF